MHTASGLTANRARTAKRAITVALFGIFLSKKAGHAVNYYKLPYLENNCSLMIVDCRGDREFIEQWSPYLSNVFATDKHVAVILALGIIVMCDFASKYRLALV